jgi:hypothetical protein
VSNTYYQYSMERERAADVLERLAQQEGGA